MDEFWLILAVFGFVAVGAGLTVAFYWFSEQRARSIVNEKASRKAVDAKADDAEELMTFFMEIRLAYDAHKNTGGDVKSFMAKVPEIALKHPKLMIRFGSRLQKLMAKGDIEELLGGFEK